MNNQQYFSGRRDSGTFLKVITFIVLLLIYTGYALRCIVSYNFESLFVVVLLILLVLGTYNKGLDRTVSLWWFTGLFLFYFGSSTISLLIFHDVGDLSLHKVNILALFPAFLLLSWLLYQSKLSIDYFWLFLMFASMVMLFWAALEMQKVGANVLDAKFRLGDLYSNPIKFGVYANALFILMLGGIVWAYKKSRVVFALWILLLLSDLAMVILSQTRTAWIGWPEAIIGWGAYYLFLVWKSDFSMFKKTSITISPILVVLILFASDPVKQIFDKRIHAAVDNVSVYLSGENYDTSIGKRLMMYETAIEMIKAKPITGYGAEDFAEQFKLASMERVKQRFGVEFEGFDFTHVHNQFLMTWVQYGVVAFIALSLIFFFLFYYFIRGIRVSSDEVKPIFIAGLVFTVATLLAFMPESPLEFSGYSAHYLLFFTVLFTFSLSENQLRAQ